MLAKLKAVKDKASGLIDKAQDKAVDLLVQTLHPKVCTAGPALHAMQSRARLRCQSGLTGCVECCSSALAFYTLSGSGSKRGGALMSPAWQPPMCSCADFDHAFISCHIHPPTLTQVHTVIDGRVDAFRDQTLEVCPSLSDSCAAAGDAHSWC